MCSSFLTRGGLPIPEELSPRGATPDFVEYGGDTVLVKRRWGAGGLGVEWATMTYGMETATDGRAVRTIGLDRAANIRDWDGNDFSKQLCAVPMYGYRQFRSAPWTRITPGWALGFFNPDAARFLLVVSEEGEYRRPVVAAWDTTRRWLLSETYEQMRLLRDIAEAASEERDAAA